MVREGEGRVESVEGRGGGVNEDLEDVDGTGGVGLEVLGTLGFRVDEGLLLVGVGVGFDDGVGKVGREEGGDHVRRVDEGLGVNLDDEGLGVNLEDVRTGGVNLEEVRTGGVNLEEDGRTVLFEEVLGDKILVDGTGGVNLEEDCRTEEMTVEFEVGNGGVTLEVELEGVNFVDDTGGVNLEEDD